MKAVLMAALVGACGFSGNSQPDAAVEIDAPAGTAAIAPATADFGLCTANTPCAPKTFTVTAAGRTPTLEVALVGTGASRFSLMADTCSGKELPDAGTCTIQVAFTQAGPLYGARAAQLQVSARAAFTTSSALTADYELLGDLTITGSPYDFGIQPVGTTSGTRTITIGNTSSIRTGTASVVKGGTDPGDFTIVANTCGGTTLAGFTTCTIQVAIAPNSVGSKSATVDFIANPGGTLSASFIGVGESLQITTVPVMFGTVELGVTSAATRLTVTNVAANPVGPLVTSFAGNHPGDFVLTNDTCNGMTVPKLATCTVDVQFKPTLAGMRDGLFRITVAGSIIADGILRGTGIPPVPITISPPSFAFPSTTSGMTSTAQTFTVSNASAQATGTLASALAGTDPTQFAIVAADTCTGQSVPAGGTCTINVVFKPTATGAKSATLTLTGTPGGSASATVSGTGL